MNERPIANHSRNISLYTLRLCLRELLRKTHNNLRMGRMKDGRG